MTIQSTLSIAGLSSPNNSRGPLGLRDFGLRERDDKVVSVTGRGAKQKTRLVANFTVEQIRSGTARYLNQPGRPVHIVDVAHSTSGSSSVEIVDSLYDARAYQRASQGRLLINNECEFCTYLNCRIDDGVQQDDLSVDRVYLVGAYVDDGGKLIASDGVEFPRQREECWYHGHCFADSGDKSVFDDVAALQNNDSIRMLLVWGLGAPLKGALGWAYPHLDASADSGVGKSTISEILHKRFGWPSMAGPTEFATDYRSKKAVANSVMPIQVQEVGRLDLAAITRLTRTLNLAYNVEPTSHGNSDKHYVLCAPALLWGQDLPFTDVAITAKLVRVDLTAEAKAPAALSTLHTNSNVWPMREWVEFLCNWANQRDVKALVDMKAAWLKKQLAGCDIRESSNSDRALWNYAVLLVVADALNAFGVTVDIGASVTEQARRHLVEQAAEQVSVARRVINDLLLEIQKSGSGAILHDLCEDGLYFKPENVLKTLRSRGYRYDISSPQKLIQMLKREKLGTPSVRQRVGGIQIRYFFIPAATLKEFDFEYDG